MKLKIMPSFIDGSCSFQEMRRHNRHFKCQWTDAKIAIVSVLAMNPDIIAVDEPTAGLDPHKANDKLCAY